MDNKDSGSSLAFWLSGSAVIFSLVVSTFALTRSPFFEFRPADTHSQVELPIRARLWQDPFGALEFRRENQKGGDGVCTDTLVGKPQSKDVADVGKSVNDSTVLPTEPRLGTSDEPPSIMVALVEGGFDSDVVELRRRIRYAILTGLNSSRMVPDDEQGSRCLKLTNNLTNLTNETDISSKTGQSPVEVPYEIFISDPFDPPTDINKKKHLGARTILFWVREESLGSHPLQKLEVLRKTLTCNIGKAYSSLQTCPPQPDSAVLKIVGPSMPKTLRAMYRQDDEGIEVPNIEIYSPLVSSSKKMLMQTLNKPRHGVAVNQQAMPMTRVSETQMKLLRTISDDDTIASILLDELKLRQVDPATSMRCNNYTHFHGYDCHYRRPPGQNRIVLISEWDSFNSRALIESFREEVAEQSRIDTDETALTNDWILSFSYFRGLDGNLPTESSKPNKPTENNNKKDNNQLTSNQLAQPYGNSQLDYLQRLTDLIENQDEIYRRNGESGIGAIGVLGNDIYDKLLVLQTLKSRMPYKVFFTTNLDSQILQRSQLSAARNLVLAAHYGLTLPFGLKQHILPFRDSLQTAIYISVLAAQSPQSFKNKLDKFDYSKSSMLSPRIYEVGISGFIPLGARLNAADPINCQATFNNQGQSPDDILAWRCLQDPPPPLYPDAFFLHKNISNVLSFFSAGPLSLILLVLAIFVGWWWINMQPIDNTQLRWRRRAALVFYILSAICVYGAVRYWRIELMWGALALILMGFICSQLALRVSLRSRLAGARFSNVNRFSGFSIWPITAPPIIVFTLALLWAYQNRSSLTENGLGEPIYFFEGISAWPALTIRLFTMLITLSALTWGWRCIQAHDEEIRLSYHLPVCRVNFWQYFTRIARQADQLRTRKLVAELARYLFRILVPLSTTSTAWTKAKASTALYMHNTSQSDPVSAARLWREYCLCGTFGARLIRAFLATWLLFVITSPIYAVWPSVVGSTRGLTPSSALLWQITMGPLISLQLLVFWIIDANRLRTRFIRQLSSSRIIWPPSLQAEHLQTFAVRQHPCIDGWVTIKLIAQRSIAVNRLIYAPTAVLLLLVVSCNKSLTDLPTPPSMFVLLFLTALLLFASAFSLRRTAEKAREMVLHRVDDYLFQVSGDVPSNEKFLQIRERIATLNTGAFSRYSEEPLIRALFLLLTGIGGSAIVDTLNYFKF